MKPAAKPALKLRDKVRLTSLPPGITQDMLDQWGINSCSKATVVAIDEDPEIPYLIEFESFHVLWVGLEHVNKVEPEEDPAIHPDADESPIVLLATLDLALIGAATTLWIVFKFVLSRMFS